MRDVLTRQECDALLCDRSMTIDQTLQAAARLGAERAMQAPDEDLPEMLEQLPRLKDWYEIGPAQRAEVDTLVGWVRARERERAAKMAESEDVAPTDDPLGVQQCIADSIRRGEEG